MKALYIVLLVLFSGHAWSQSTAELTRQAKEVEARWGQLSDRQDLRQWAPDAYEIARQAAEKVIRGHWSVERDVKATRNYRADRLMEALEVISRGNQLESEVNQLIVRRDQLQTQLNALEAARAAELALAEERKRIAEEQKLLADAISREAEEEKRLAEQRERLAYDERLKAEQQQQLAEQAARVAESNRQAAELAADLERTNAEYARAQAVVAQRKAAEAQSRAQALEALLTDTQSELALAQSGRGAVFVLGDVLFETNGDRLLPGAFAQLDELTRLLEAHPKITAQIEGHTDSTGSQEYNIDLSRRRARSVRDYLADNGVASGRLKSIGLGEALPIATNDTPEGRQQNRRVEVIMNSAGIDG